VLQHLSKQKLYPCQISKKHAQEIGKAKVAASRNTVDLEFLIVNSRKCGLIYEHDIWKGHSR